MRFMLMFKPDRNPEPGDHGCKQNLPEMAKLIGELKSSGVLLTTVVSRGSRRAPTSATRADRRA